jgi:FkbM family methyltransferase
MARTIVNDLSQFGRHAPTGIVARLLPMTRAMPETWAGKRRAFLLRSMGVTALAGRPADVESFGARMRLYPYNNVCEKRILFTPQYFDPKERDFLASRITPDYVFIDLGANVGGYSLFVAALAGPNARILSVEPQPEIFERLIYNVRQNPFAKIKALECAVADRDGDITMFLDLDNRGESSMRMVLPTSNGGAIRVPARPLAAIIADEGFERVDAIKLDIEGAEDLVLEPFFRDSPESLWPRTILLEYSPARWSIDLSALLQGLGYKEVLRTDQNVAYEREISA